MRLYHRYLLNLAVVSGGVDAVLAFMRQTDLTLYFTLNVAAFLAVTLLFTQFDRRARRALNAVGIALFATFALIVGLKVAQILVRT